MVKCKALTTTINACASGMLGQARTGTCTSQCYNHAALLQRISFRRNCRRAVVFQGCLAQGAAIYRKGQIITASLQQEAKEEWLALPFPEKGSIWYELNRSALDAEAGFVGMDLALHMSRSIGRAV